MVEEYAAAITPGGTNIEARLLPAIKLYKEGKTSIIVFVGTRQGPRASECLEQMGVPEFSEETRRGYIIFPRDPSTSTTQNAYVARYLLNKYGIEGDLYLSTEQHHSRAKPQFKKFFPQHKIELETIKIIKNPVESAIRWVQAAVSRATDLFLMDLPAARTDEEAYAIYSRDYKVEKAMRFLRHMESMLYLASNSKSQKMLKGELITEKGDLVWRSINL